MDQIADPDADEHRDEDEQSEQVASFHAARNYVGQKDRLFLQSNRRVQAQQWHKFWKFLNSCIGMRQVILYI